MDDPQTPIGFKYVPLPPDEDNEMPYDPEFMDFQRRRTEEPVLSKEALAHISWRDAQGGLGKWLIEFQFLETAIKDAIAFLIDKNDLRLGNITTARMQFLRIRQSNAPSGSGVFLMQSRDDGNCRGWPGEAAKPPRN
jgi:hypothetical protein